MSKIKVISIVMSFCIYIQVQAQEHVLEKGFLIVQSTKDYSSALKTVKQASQNLGLEINLRGFYPDHEMGLKTDSLCGCGENHGYVARGRYDDGIYVSIELSDSYEGFTKGFYIVVVASGFKDTEQLTETLKNTKKYYPNAYLKNSAIYLGCMH